MLSLNLISKELKKEIKIKHIYRLINKTGLIFIFTTILIGAVFLSAKYLIYESFKSLNEQMNLTPAKNKNYNIKIKEINDKLGVVLNIQNEFIPYSELLNEIINEIPKNITIDYLKIDGDKKTVRIRGVAQDRDTLLELKNKLKNISILSNVDLPLTNILEKTNINFEINAGLVLNNLQK